VIEVQELSLSLMGSLSGGEQQIIGDEEGADYYGRISQVEYGPRTKIDKICYLSEANTVYQVAYSTSEVEP
jgi:hypothetical protein